MPNDFDLRVNGNIQDHQKKLLWQNYNLQKMYEAKTGVENVHKYTDYKPEERVKEVPTKPTKYAWFVLFLMFIMRVVHQ